MSTAGEFTEYDGEEYNEGHKAENHKREHVVEQKHCAEDTEDNEDIFDKVYQNVGKGYRDGIGVVCNSCNQSADGNFIELIVRKALNMREKVLTDAGHYALSRFLQDDRLKIGADQRDYQYRGVGDDADI